MKKIELRKFKEIYFKKFGEKISDREALASATNLINLYKTVYKSNNKTNEINRKKI